MTPLPQQAILVVNSMSRSGAEAFDEVRDKLAAAGVELLAAHAITDPDQMEPTICDAIAQAPMVIVGGGDGSLSTNVSSFMGKDTVFAIVPLGTANSFAGTLGIPKDIDSAVAVIANGERKRIDLGCIDGHFFVNAAAIGLSPMIAETVPPKLKRYLGMVGYLLWAARCAFKFRPFRVTVEYDDGRHKKVWATEVRIANGTHHGGVEMVESQEIDSGVIVIQAVTGKSVWGLGWSWFATVTKLRGRHGTTREFRGRKMRLGTQPRLDISIDGEIAARTPVTISVAKGAIEVAAPRDGQFQI
ncbi:diacylglycerol kinase family protein [Novosphingobium sp. Gsoil 351]|uniref:diacylglycerol kinase family protein n=1 Tax=Novosphingobium sp. Gsoil 351 TaxID=2675225 RepID=UPI0012B500EE|nr:diacylglycerol kinase family protein [Novosphingobium sp. Gsoil 351]QGN54976.1 diacylglycerol kinase [Novosphingobium sp. Gsoil 351]